MARARRAASVKQPEPPTLRRGHLGHRRKRLLSGFAPVGVIRRHPDIKLLRRAGDIAGLAAQQAALLEAMWPLLSAGGMLLYTTCSVLAEENERQVARFLSEHADAGCRPGSAAWGRAGVHGRQLLSGDDGMDGFYFACIYKV